MLLSTKKILAGVASLQAIGFERSSCLQGSTVTLASTKEAVVASPRELDPGMEPCLYRPRVTLASTAGILDDDQDLEGPDQRTGL